jgi:CheY-like chemotaxis protein
MTHRILVVEDNLANRELLCDWLESRGFEVQAAENLNDAFLLFESQTFHAVLLDIQLGQEDGLTFALKTRLEASYSHIPIIAVTAHAMVTDHERVMQAGCNACISKPIDFKLLLRQLQQWLTLKNGTRQQTPAV